jgi:hypothetical protein
MNPRGRDEDPENGQKRSRLEMEDDTDIIQGEPETAEVSEADEGGVETTTAPPPAKKRKLNEQDTTEGINLQERGDEEAETGDPMEEVDEDAEPLAARTAPVPFVDQQEALSRERALTTMQRRKRADKTERERNLDHLEVEPMEMEPTEAEIVDGLPPALDVLAKNLIRLRRQDRAENEKQRKQDIDQLRRETARALESNRMVRVTDQGLVMTTMAQAPLMISLTEEEKKIQQEASELTEAVVNYHVPDSHRKPLEGLLKVWKKENPNIDGESLDFAEQIIYRLAHINVMIRLMAAARLEVLREVGWGRAVEHHVEKNGFSVFRDKHGAANLQADILSGNGTMDTAFDHRENMLDVLFREKNEMTTLLSKKVKEWLDLDPTPPTADYKHTKRLLDECMHSAGIPVSRTKNLPYGGGIIQMPYIELDENQKIARLLSENELRARSILYIHIHTGDSHDGTVVRLCTQQQMSFSTKSERVFSVVTVASCGREITPKKWSCRENCV